MSWWRRLFGQTRPEPPRVLEPEDHEELAKFARDQKRLLTAADEAIENAMKHADRVMTGYRGPDRRSHPR